ncbi:MAG: alpha-ketoglutarate-dependent dioxygenase AlkB, partial [Acidimicrobiaceae bacterium]|nr:alpha-ketoglutarate-dependent dioxygenase AlkB [Acidimicrobiaceae bacterium]
HPDAKWLDDLSRRVMHFGYKYDYTSRMLDESALIGPLPEWLQQLAQKVRETASEKAQQRLEPDQPFDQAIINEYDPGQGIAAHIDRDCFGPIIATVSLRSAINMDFYQKSTDKSADKSTEKSHIQRVEERSLIVLQDAARNEWSHEIKKRKSDPWQGQKIKRSPRISITFRTIGR